MNTILNFISAAAAFIFGVGVIYIFLDATIGKLKFLHSKFEWYGLQVKDFVFLVISGFVILSFTSVVLPY